MRQLSLVLLVGALAFSGAAFFGTARADEGVNPDDDTTNSTIEDLFLGQHWFGAEIEDEDLQGKVVLFEIWGS